jgi:TonB family protein
MRNFGSAKSRVLPGFFIAAMLSSLLAGQAQAPAPATSTLGRMQAKIAASAREHQQSPLPRLILFEVSFPTSAEEATALKGNTMLLVSMITRVVGERPIKRVSVTKDGHEYALFAAGSFWSQTGKDTTEFKAFGEFRQDALFFLPMNLISPESDLSVQLDKQEKGLDLGSLAFLQPNLVGLAGAENRPASLDVKISDLKAVAAREFPGIPFMPTRIRISSGVAAGLLVKKTNPVYPEDAKQNRLQGVVVLRTTIGKDGLIKDLQLVSGHPALFPAAMDAVRRWEYKPYSLNGEPVEVETTITVNFTLNR